MKPCIKTENIQDSSTFQYDQENILPSSENNSDPRRDIFRDFPDVVGIDQICVMLGGVGRKTVTALLKNKKIPYIRIGREYKVAKPDIISFVLNSPIDDEFFEE